MCIDNTMGHRNITISDEAYHELSKMKRERESFTDVVMRLASGRGSAKALLTYVKGASSNEDLAKRIEMAMERTRKASLAKVATT